MKKFRHQKFETRLKQNGLSLIELLTSVMIIGIATAGTMELAYVNAFWAANGMNKADNLYVARRFLDVLNRDLRGTVILSKGNTPILNVTSNATTLSFFRSQDLSQGGGFPTTMIPVAYTVIPDPNSTDLAATDYLIQRQEGTGTPVTILSGLVGPVSTSSPSLQVFQYSSNNPSDPQDGLNPTPSNTNPSPISQTNSVVVNLELKRVNFDSATAAMNANTNHSFEAIRSEIFLRNSSLGMGM
jgi:prepilin-type N-terminal cleavage/methylation domain-containing protein